MCAEDDLAAVGEAGSVEEAIAEARALRPDVIVLDAALCKEGEGDIVQVLAHEHPAGKVLVLSVQDEPQDVREAFELGASGYVLKQATETELVSAIREVAAGGRYVSPDLGARLIAAETAERRGTDGDPLSDREREVLRLLALGHTNRKSRRSSTSPCAPPRRTVPTSCRSSGCRPAPSSCVTPSGKACWRRSRAPSQRGGQG